MKWIAIISAELDLIPFQKIIFTNTKRLHAIPIAEYTINAML
ncbi:hypothetical protein [Salipaludibacillus neizhouensis]|nr:hypothetical protein [Salipaludibacillus neizhouensis]